MLTSDKKRLTGGGQWRLLHEEVSAATDWKCQVNSSIRLHGSHYAAYYGVEADRCGDMVVAIRALIEGSRPVRYAYETTTTALNRRPS